MPQPRPEINRHELRTRSLPELEALLLDTRRCPNSLVRVERRRKSAGQAFQLAGSRLCGAPEPDLAACRADTRMPAGHRGRDVADRNENPDSRRGQNE